MESAVLFQHCVLLEHRRGKLERAARHVGRDARHCEQLNVSPRETRLTFSYFYYLFQWAHRANTGKYSTQLFEDQRKVHVSIRKGLSVKGKSDRCDLKCAFWCSLWCLVFQIYCLQDVMMIIFWIFFFLLTKTEWHKVFNEILTTEILLQHLNFVTTVFF